MKTRTLILLLWVINSIPIRRTTKIVFAKKDIKLKNSIDDYVALDWNLMIEFRL